MTILAHNGLNDGNPLREFKDETQARDYFDEKVKAIRSVKANSNDHEFIQRVFGSHTVRKRVSLGQRISSVVRGARAYS